MNKELKLIIQPKVIDHLGIKMYQKPVDVISEFIANSWDANSEIVDVKINHDSIFIQDDGLGMTFEQCQDYFLTVGRDRRLDTGQELTEEKERPILGRKGIGKFSGFGIAKKIEIKTFAKINGEMTHFEMDIEEILKYDASGQVEKPIKVIKFESGSDATKRNHGTIVSLIGIDGKSIDLEKFKEELSRRFLLSQMYYDFKITVNEEPLSESFNEPMDIVFPRDLTEEDKEKIPNLQSIDDKGWAREKFDNYEILWRIGFYEEPIETEELRGISIFAKGKLAQKPFVFDLVGGISGQHAIEYMTGQVKMDFIDEGINDMIATERQRINLQSDLGKKIQAWGIEKIKLLSSIWKRKRSEKRIQELEDRLEGLRDRLEQLPSTERKTVKSVLLKIASFERLGKKRFYEWSNSILTSWEAGRLKELILKMSEKSELDEAELLEILYEADILTALNIAESIKTKVLAIGELKQRINSKQLENKVRDYIYEHPWIIHPKWESFKKERSINKIIEDAGARNLDYEPFNGRVDLALSSGSDLLLVEFMKPGLEIDRDHLDRINYYVIDIRKALERETGNPIRTLNSAYIIADNFRDFQSISERLNQLERDKIFIMTWNTLTEQAIKQWKEQIEILKSRNPGDKRIQDL